jgi:hypothetical protein
MPALSPEQAEFLISKRVPLSKVCLTRTEWAKASTTTQ